MARNRLRLPQPEDAKALCAITPAANNYGIAVQGQLDRATHHVSRLYAKAGEVYQQAGGNYWYCSNDDGTWHSASDPTREDPTPIDPDRPPPRAG